MMVKDIADRVLSRYGVSPELRDSYFRFVEAVFYTPIDSRCDGPPVFDPARLVPSLPAFSVFYSLLREYADSQGLDIVLAFGRLEKAWDEVCDLAEARESGSAVGLDPARFRGGKLRH